MIKTLLEMKEEVLLPIGMAEFHEFCDTILDTYDANGMTIGDVPRDQLKWVIANLILELKPTVTHLTGEEVFFRLRHTAAKQVASAFFVEMKERQARLDSEKAMETEEK